MNVATVHFMTETICASQDFCSCYSFSDLRNSYTLLEHLHDSYGKDTLSQLLLRVWVSGFLYILKFDQKSEETM